MQASSSLDMERQIAQLRLELLSRPGRVSARTMAQTALFFGPVAVRALIGSAHMPHPHQPPPGGEAMLGSRMKWAQPARTCGPQLPQQPYATSFIFTALPSESSCGLPVDGDGDVVGGLHSRQDRRALRQIDASAPGHGRGHRRGSEC